MNYRVLAVYHASTYLYTVRIGQKHNRTLGKNKNVRDSKSSFNSYLHNSIQMVTHGYFWHIAHQVIKPVIQTCQYIDGVATLPE